MKTFGKRHFSRFVGYSLIFILSIITIVLSRDEYNVFLSSRMTRPQSGMIAIYPNLGQKFLRVISNESNGKVFVLAIPVDPSKQEVYTHAYSVNRKHLWQSVFGTLDGIPRSSGLFFYGERLLLATGAASAGVNSHFRLIDQANGKMINEDSKYIRSNDDSYITGLVSRGFRIPGMDANFLKYLPLLRDRSLGICDKSGDLVFANYPSLKLINASIKHGFCKSNYLNYKIGRNGMSYVRQPDSIETIFANGSRLVDDGFLTENIFYEYLSVDWSYFSRRYVIAGKSKDARCKNAIHIYSDFSKDEYRRLCIREKIVAASIDINGDASVITDNSTLLILRKD